MAFFRNTKKHQGLESSVCMESGFRSIKSGIHNMRSIIQDSLVLPYMGRMPTRFPPRQPRETYRLPAYFKSCTLKKAASPNVGYNSFERRELQTTLRRNFNLFPMLFWLLIKRPAESKNFTFPTFILHC